jgi:hypothetical protein
VDSPLRSEEAAFRLLIWVVVVVAAIVALIVVVQALT